MPCCLELRIVGSMKKILIYNEIIASSAITHPGYLFFPRPAAFIFRLSAYNTLNTKNLQLLFLHYLNNN